jgi:FAD/FMN-containing dehydrogenase
LWAYREAHTEAVSAAGIPVKLDVSVPLRELPSLAAQLPPTVDAIAPDARLVIWGHLNEGNLHVNVLDAGSRGTEVTDAVLNLVATHRGSISSEHGVGRAKARWLALSRSAEEIATMRRIRTALDPAGLLNPGVLFAENA